VIELRGVTRQFEVGGRPVHALRGIDLTIEPGEHVSIIGPSGSGKSTLLNIIGCLDRPTSGSYRLDDREVAGLDDRALSRVRGRQIGFVFQAYHLVPRMTAAQNVELPLLYGKVPRRDRAQRAAEALERVGLADRARHRPAELSGGQRQRVAIARALVTQTSLLLADEPTGNLDTTTGEEILALFDELHRAGNTVLVVTHEADVAARAERTLRVLDGRIVSDTTRTGHHAP
jgi:putative ABC transport system ATP-binding protein